MKKGLIIFFVIILVLLAAAGGTFLYLKNWYEGNLKAVGSEGKGEEIKLEIEKGTGTADIAALLEKNKVIRNADAFKIYLKLNKKNNLQAGKYSFNNGKEDVKAVVEKLTSGDVDDDSVTITFVEGKTIKDYAKTIASKTNNTMEEVFDLLKDEEYINSLIEKYWFLTDEIKNEDIYYPLEGYLKPDTYTFENEDVSISYIFNYILNYTEKFLDTYREDIENSGYTVHEILSLASIIEKEASNTEDMPGISGVFYNRLKSKMSLGSDVTTYYAFQIDLAESDLTNAQINTYNAYNTRGPNMNGKLPVGPICNPSENAMKAAINPEISDYYYFVSDKTGKTYFTKNYNEHQKLVQQLKADGLWYVYE
ncbi:MAG: endolytic transglycosylase MltG [Clostridia bacterium]|nr:endolytic transglycosylase MltG [Clostridia bacterium]